LIKTKDTKKPRFYGVFAFRHHDAPPAAIAKAKTSTTILPILSESGLCVLKHKGKIMKLSDVIRISGVYFCCYLKNSVLSFLAYV
jgi:hypothetical protein